MKFDHIIMNPPYSGSLHLKILREAMKHSDDIVNLSPITELINITERTKEVDFIEPHIMGLDVIKAESMSSMFNILIRKDCGIWHICPSKNGTFNNPKSKFSSIYKKVKKQKSWRNVCEHEYKTFSLPMQGDNGLAKGWHLTFEETFNGKPSACINFNSQEEINNFKKTWGLKIYRLIYELDGKSVVPAHMPFLPDYTHPWTDEMLYKYFGLTDEEIKTIENDSTNYIIRRK